MSLTLSYGTKDFDVDGCSMGYNTVAIRSEAGRPVRWLIKFSVECLVLGNGLHDLSDKETRIANALAQPYKDLVLKQNDGSIAGISIFDKRTFSGVMITEGPSFEDSGKPGEYVTFRTLRFGGEAQMVIPGQQDAIISYQESVSVTGNGGPIRRWRFPINARPIRQIVSPGSIIRTVQQGRLVSHTRRIKAPPPFYGRAYLVNEAEAVKETQPKPLGGGWVEFGVEWTYIYESTVLPKGLPVLPRM